MSLEDDFKNRHHPFAQDEAQFYTKKNHFYVKNF